MVLADLGKKITSALKSLSTATVISEEVCFSVHFTEIYVRGATVESLGTVESGHRFLLLS